MPRIGGIIIVALLASAGCKDNGKSGGAAAKAGSAAEPAKVPGHCRNWGKCYDNDDHGPMTACESSGGKFTPGPCPAEERVGRCTYSDGVGTRYYYKDWTGPAPEQDCANNGAGWTYQPGS